MTGRLAQAHVHVGGSLHHLGSKWPSALVQLRPAAVTKEVPEHTGADGCAVTGKAGHMSQLANVKGLGDTPLPRCVSVEMRSWTVEY